ncbi:MAG: twin-arginine translocase TatA/TatE family subunit [Synechococcus sp.]
MSIFGMGIPELAVIGVIAVVVFGPKKLPELGSSMGKAIRGFKDEMNSDSKDEDATPTKIEVTDTEG